MLFSLTTVLTKISFKVHFSLWKVQFKLGFHLKFIFHFGKKCLNKKQCKLNSLLNVTESNPNWNVYSEAMLTYRQL